MLVSLIDTTNNELLSFPVTPSKVTFERGAIKIGIESIVLGDIPWGRGRNAETVHLSGIFPGYKQNIPRNNDLPPSVIDKKLKDILDHKPFAKELRFIITSENFTININMPVFLDDYTPIMEIGDDTLHYSITLKEYRSYRLRRFDTVNKKVTTKEAKRTTPPTPQTYTVKKGDNLWAITRRQLGSGARYMELFNHNKSRLRSKNPSLIYPGEVLHIPESWLKK